jgi:hypothetical protein
MSVRPRSIALATRRISDLKGIKRNFANGPIQFGLLLFALNSHSITIIFFHL